MDLDGVLQHLHVCTVFQICWHTCQQSLSAHVSTCSVVNWLGWVGVCAMGREWIEWCYDFLGVDGMGWAGFSYVRNSSEATQFGSASACGKRVDMSTFSASCASCNHLPSSSKRLSKDSRLRTKATVETCRNMSKHVKSSAWITGSSIMYWNMFCLRCYASVASLGVLFYCCVRLLQSHSHVLQTIKPDMTAFTAKVSETFSDSNVAITCHKIPYAL